VKSVRSLLMTLVVCAVVRESVGNPHARCVTFLTPVLSARTAWSAGEAQSTASGNEGPAPAIDFAHERAVVEESNAALKALDHVTARAKAAEAVEALLARPESERNSDWLAALDSAGRAAWFARDVRSASAAWRSVLAVRERTLPADHLQLQRTRINVAATLKTLGEANGARMLEEQVLEVYARTLTPDHAELQGARASLASTLQTQGELAGARGLFEQVLKTYERTLSPDHPELQRARLNLASTLHTLGDFAGMRALAEQALEVRTRTLPGDHHDLQKARLGLAAALLAQGENAAARELLEQVVEVFTRTRPPDDAELQSTRSNLAVSMQALGDLAGARVLFGQALEVLARTRPADDPELQAVRANLANTQLAMGDLAGARALLEQVLEVLTRTLPGDHPELQLVRQNVAITIKELGDFAGARVLEEQVIEILAHALPADHPRLQVARMNLANTLSAMGDRAGARALLELVLEVQTSTLPADHPAVQDARQNLANLLHSAGDFAGARVLFELVLEARVRTLPKGHPKLRAAQGNLANALRDLGDFDVALALEEAVLEDCARTLPADHPELHTARSNLAWTLAGLQTRGAFARGGAADQASQARTERCAALLRDLCRSTSAAAFEALLTSSSREAEERCVGLAERLNIALTFAGGYGAIPPMVEMDRASVVLSETTRAAAIASAALQRRLASTPRYAELRVGIQHARHVLAGLAQKGTNTDAFQRALAQREALERELVTLAQSDPSIAGTAVAFDADECAALLGARTAAVGYRRYTRWSVHVLDEPDATLAPRLEQRSVESLCALVVRADETADRSGPGRALVTRIDLGPVAAIEELVRAWRTTLGTDFGRGLGDAKDPAKEQSVSSSITSGAELRRRVFDPLLPALQSVDRVIVALDDVLHLVPIDALPLDAVDGASSERRPLVGDRWRIEVRTTLTELLSPSRVRDESGALVAFGGASFQSPPLGLDDVDQVVAAADRWTHFDVRGLLRGAVWELGFPPLEHTGREAREIAALHAETTGNDVAARVLEERKASRANFEQLAPQARWLHVATHGWFAPTSVRSWTDLEPLDEKSGLGTRQSSEEQIRGMSPMLLCGLALAGANLPPDVAGRAEGLITAEEIAALDLSACELAVLSACDTSVGERRSGQGVASLQRALQMAGARSVITALWKVPDEATRELMVEFYRRLWVDKKPKYRALWEAKMHIRDAKDDGGRPKYVVRDWAAWVLTGEPD